MENECLLTKLSGAVENIGLCTLNGLLLIVPKNTNNWGRIASMAQGGHYVICTIQGNNNVYFTDSTYTNNLGREIEVSDNFYVKNASNEDAFILINDKSRLRSIFEYEHQDQLNLAPQFFNGNFLKYCPYLTQLIISGSGIMSKYIKECPSLVKLQLRFNKKSIELNDIKETSLTVIELTYCPIIGDISLLSSLTDMTALTIRFCTGISGTLESLLVGLLNNGKTTQLDCFIYENVNPVTFHGVQTLYAKHYIVTFATNSVSVSVDGNVVGTYDGTSWSYS